MSELPPSSRDNPLLNTNQPQRAGYLSPSSTPTPAAPPPTPVPFTITPPPAITSPPQPAPAPKRIKPQVSSLASIIDTLEAIIIALILALSFRAFVVEAFVIPTGSMAPTLLGAHFDVTCPSCGYSFKETASLEVQYNPTTHQIEKTPTRGELSNSTYIPAPEWRLCPNCGFGINVKDLPGNPVPRSGERVGGRFTNAPLVFFPWANNGDRILVLKYLYSILEPQRWDVIVFKEPREATDNYIKRLVGLPGESLQVVGGDLFVRPPSGPGEPEKPFAIARKPRHVQAAVWQLVYNNDFFPTDADEPRNANVSIPFTTPWKGQGATQDGWKTKGTVIRYDAPPQEGQAGVPGELRFTPRDWYLFNVRGYNNDLADGYGPVTPAIKDHEPVTDVRLEAVWQTNADAGRWTIPPQLGLIVGPESFQFRVRWHDKGLTLERWDAGTQHWSDIPEISAPKLAPPVPGRAYRVAVENMDHQVRFFIDDRMIFEYQVPWSIEDAKAYAQRQQEHPELAQLALQVDRSCTLSHLLVQSDVYYTDHLLAQNIMAPYRMEKSPLQTSVTAPVHLEADEFFVMGDNSTASYDSRGWSREQKIDPSLQDLPVWKDRHYGIVPRRFLLGRAFFVYWPAGFRPMNGAAPDLLRITDVPLVPNVGEMRFIR